jgi:hypothetical protein
MDFTVCLLNYKSEENCLDGIDTVMYVCIFFSEWVLFENGDGLVNGVGRGGENYGGSTANDSLLHWLQWRGGSTTPRVTSVTPVTPGRLQDRERRRHEGTLLADLGSNLGSGAPGSGGWNVCIDVSSNILLTLYPRRSSRGLLSLSFEESTFY